MAGALFTACENGDWEFSDYKYSAVYFAYQSPVRTITLGEDESVATSLRDPWPYRPDAVFPLYVGR